MCSTKYQFVVVDGVRLYSGDMTVHNIGELRSRSCCCCPVVVAGAMLICYSIVTHCNAIFLMMVILTCY